ncbi:MAG TPA: rhodanese-like domain-containing protein [Rhizomicrobium sp.]
MTSVGNVSGYAGDINPSQAWELLARDPKAQLVDVRTAAEWAFVGLPDLSSVGREVHRVQWQQYPEMSVNPEFVRMVAGQLQASGASLETPVLFLCRSGGRSRAAAVAMTASGYRSALNVTGGFEGDADAAGHRGTIGGWKAAGLPWRQS